MIVYLAGPVEEAKADEALVWRDLLEAAVFNVLYDNVKQKSDDRRVQEEIHEAYMSDFTFLNPLRGHRNYMMQIAAGNKKLKDITKELPFTTANCISRRCFQDVAYSTVVVVNLLKLGEKRAMGTMMEIGAAMASDATVITIVEEDSPLREHPMLKYATSLFVSDIDAAAEALVGYEGIE